MSMRGRLPLMSGVAGSFGTKFENYPLSNADGSASFDGAVWAAQVFKANTAHTLTGVKLPIFASSGDPGNVTVGIQALSGGDPDGTDLVFVTFPGSALPVAGGELFLVALPALVLPLDALRAIVVRAVSGNSVSWQNDSSTPTYADGQQERSTDSGTNWTAQAGDFCFENWGFAP